MARTHYSDERYESDDSSLADSPRSRHRRRAHSEESPYTERPRARPRHARRHSSYASEKTRSKWQSAGKVALGVAFVGIVAQVVNRWVEKREIESIRREEDRVREKRRQFEKAKAKRRREEDRREREREDRSRGHGPEVWEVTEEVRRIGYLPAEERGRSESRAPRRLEAPPSREASIDEWEEDQVNHHERRGRAERSRSRPAVDVT
ncbi:hypothetical protein CLAFUW4_05637 [Fulvia fulva]|uniref:Uncharacterized protein n=1 Tax=Passalora fulva TaxID=5499 RepID=A0A9Q8LI50_PASFU|nr:uncharacterized protein CLAFUR5_05778 [Fulvia fulva]KAK4624121.1 hypothetical protein CLAFUR4_05632 [Fulvia fulva]KAK4625750.1 hypothetical protein CLAFUR0_05640 [Fulvia fulva]UJO17831.1 hypothetical protein CLAFUR5_05778 [Fulvia fulva]WPV14753.1 hypothetical protein CLAFUW4_05637 [Fulvia fulva]WPV30412.1 hypothetical protein CLAFUW7_05636 [Fulvia fulva]